MKLKQLQAVVSLLLLSIVANAQTNTFPSSGNVGIGTNSPVYPLHVNGASFFDGQLNTNSLSEKVLFGSFPNGTYNLGMDIILGNNAFWGYIEVEITGSYSFQNTVGKLTKVFAVGTGPDNGVWTNESRVVDALGVVPNNISIGEFGWDNVNTRFRIPISHLVSTGNEYVIKVKAFSLSGYAATLFNSLDISSTYTLSPLPRNYPNYDVLGIGTKSPTANLHVKGENAILRVEGGTYTSVEIVDGGSGDPGYMRTYYNGEVVSQVGAGATFFNTGNVGIGTNSPSEKLAVNGNIKAKKIIVSQAGWPDYVFHPSYELKPLSEVASFIKANKHLPDVPSAKEVEEHGISLGDNQALLLKKIEELTLYVIELKQITDQQQQQIHKLQNK